MKLKKILAAALSAAMVLSCMTVSGGNVVQAAGRTTDLGENVATDLQIVAYSGHETNHTIDYVKDGVKNNEDDHQRWQSGVNLKGPGSEQGNAAYIIFDLGAEGAENSIRGFKQINVKFHREAYATDYDLYTSDTCNYNGDNMQIPKNEPPAGWEKLAHRSFNNGGLGRFPENVFSKPEDKKITKRYLMFFFKSMNTGAGANSVSIREIEIYKQAVQNITIDGEATSSNLEIDATPTKQLNATVAPENASNKGVTWSSVNPEIAAVDAETGEVRAVAPGTTTITATSKDDTTKTATHTVNVCADKTELRSLIQFAVGLDKSKYTKKTWDFLQDAMRETEVVINGELTATSFQVKEAADALLEAINGLEREYKVTVNGEDYVTGPMNTPCEIVAEDREGKTFVGWDLNGKRVSVEKTYTFYICGDMDFVAVYQEGSAVTEKTLSANMTGTVLTKRADGKANVKFVAQLSIPENYTLNETGLLWYGKPNLDSLHTEDGQIAPGVKQIVVPRISSTYQFAVNVNGIPATKTIHGEIYAKVTNKETGKQSWIFSEKVSVTNE